jgi:arginase family enzyme
MPTPGGIDHLDLLDLLHGVANKGRIMGFYLAEFVPEKDQRRRADWGSHCADWYRIE